MNMPVFRTGARRPTNIYVALDPRNPEADPQIGYIVEGWAQVLVDQANDAVAPRAFVNDTTTIEVLGQRQHMVQDLLQAAREVLKFDQPEATTSGLAAAVTSLRLAVGRFGPYDQDDEPDI